MNTDPAVLYIESATRTTKLGQKILFIKMKDGRTVNFQYGNKVVEALQRLAAEAASPERLIILKK